MRFLFVLGLGQGYLGKRKEVLVSGFWRRDLYYILSFIFVNFEIFYLYIFVNKENNNRYYFDLLVEKLLYRLKVMKLRYYIVCLMER